MKTTLHLFRHDVRRLRWWLLAWAAFLVGTHWWWSVTTWAARQSTSLEWLRKYVNPDEVAFITGLAWTGILTALLFFPHAADGVRLFWRTRPITGRDVVQAKFLFVGLFLIALPMLVETGFWLAWWPLAKLTEFWPGMLLSRTAWAALLVLVVGVAGREGKRYLFGAVGLLLAVGAWLQVGEQLQMRALAAAGAEPWAMMDSPHLLGQLAQFWVRNSPSPIHLTAKMAVVPVYVLAVAGWLVVACRYLFADWRATRLALESAVLVTVVIATGLNERGQAQPDWEAERVRRAGPLANALHRVEVRLKDARLGPQREYLGREPRADDPPGTKRGAVFDWETSGHPPGIVLLWNTARVSSDKLMRTYGGSDRGGRLHAPQMPYYVEQAGEQLAAALPELSGYAVRSKPVAAYHWVGLQAAWAEEFSGEPKTAHASVGLAALAPSTLAVLPVGQAAQLVLDQARIRLTAGREPRLSVMQPSRVTHLSLWEPGQSEGVPNLFVLRNPKTKEAIVVSRYAGEDKWGAVSAPGSSRTLNVHHLDCPLTHAAARYGLPATWLADAELLCVRMKLVGQVARPVRLENFRLEPAAVR